MATISGDFENSTLEPPVNASFELVAVRMVEDGTDERLFSSKHTVTIPSTGVYSLTVEIGVYDVYLLINNTRKKIGTNVVVDSGTTNQDIFALIEESEDLKAISGVDEFASITTELTNITENPDNTTDFDYFLTTIVYGTVA